MNFTDIDNWFDEVSAETNGIVLDDLLAALQPSQEPGYVYYSGQWGDIRGISLTPIADLAEVDFIRVPQDKALAFLDGSENADRWQVGYAASDRHNLRLIKKGADRFVRLEIIDARYVEVSRMRQVSGTLSLIIRASRGENALQFALERGMDAPEFQTEVETLEFLITRRGDPSMLHERITIAVEELLEGPVLVKTTTDLARDISLYTRRLFETCHFEYVPFLVVGVEGTKMMRFPTGHTHDLAPFRRIEVEGMQPTLVAKLNRESATLLMELQPGGRMYDRELSKMTLLFTVRRDPSMVQHGTSFSLDELYDNGSVTLSLPQAVIDGDFDIWAPLLFETMVLRDV